MVSLSVRVGAPLGFSAEFPTERGFALGVLLWSPCVIGVCVCVCVCVRIEVPGCCFLDSGDVSRTGCRDEAQPVRQRRVVDEGVSDHFFLAVVNGDEENATSDT